AGRCRKSSCARPTKPPRVRCCAPRVCRCTTSPATSPAGSACSPTPPAPPRHRRACSSASTPSGWPSRAARCARPHSPISSSASSAAQERRMRSIIALLRAAWLSATSYRVATLLSLAGVAATVIPVYFIAEAVQDLAATSIQRESASYFAFIVVGIASVYIVSAATGALATAVTSTIGNGTLEALLVTRTGIPALLAGLAAHTSVQAALRAVVLLVTATLLGAD